MTRSPMMRSPSIARGRGSDRQVSLSEVLDRVLTKGAVVAGEVVISLAGVDLVYLGINVVLTSVDTALKSKTPVGCIDVVR
jgi:gas vesicle structural protein